MNFELVGQLALGETRLALAHSEAAARGALSHVATSAVQSGNGWTLKGRKSLVLGGPHADRFVVSARVAGEVSAEDGIALFLVDGEDDSLSARHFRLADGSHASELTLDGVRLTDDALLATPDAGMAALARGHAFAIAGLCAEAVGAMEAAIWLTRDYLKTRKQFGQPLGNFQSLQHRMAEMLIEMELSRSAVFRAVAMLEAEPAMRDRAVASAKVQIGKSGKFVGGQAIQLHGGMEYAIGHYFKRLIFLDNLFGSADAFLHRLAA